MMGDQFPAGKGEELHSPLQGPLILMLRGDTSGKVQAAEMYSWKIPRAAGNCHLVAGLARLSPAPGLRSGGAAARGGKTLCRAGSGRSAGERPAVEGRAERGEPGELRTAAGAERKGAGGVREEKGADLPGVEH